MKYNLYISTSDESDEYKSVYKEWSFIPRIGMKLKVKTNNGNPYAYGIVKDVEFVEGEVRIGNVYNDLFLITIKEI